MPHTSTRERFCATFETSCASAAPLYMTTTNGGQKTLSRPFSLQGYIKQRAILLLSFLFTVLFWNGYPKRYDAKRQTGKWYFAYHK
jgi:hypothetical protein